MYQNCEMVNSNITNNIQFVINDENNKEMSDKYDHNDKHVLINQMTRMNIK